MILASNSACSSHNLTILEFSPYPIAKLLIWSIFWSLILEEVKCFFSMHSHEFWNLQLRKLPSLTIHRTQAVTLPVPETLTAGAKAPLQQAASVSQRVPGLSPYTLHSHALTPDFLPVWPQFSFGTILYISFHKAIYSQHKLVLPRKDPGWATGAPALCHAKGQQLKASLLRVPPPRAPCAAPLQQHTTLLALVVFLSTCLHPRSLIAAGSEKLN